MPVTVVAKSMPQAEQQQHKLAALVAEAERQPTANNYRPTGK